MRARRDNIKSTIAVLSRPLSAGYRLRIFQDTAPESYEFQLQRRCVGTNALLANVVDDCLVLVNRRTRDRVEFFHAAFSGAENVFGAHGLPSADFSRATE
jgi:hypothetical protein